MRHSVAIDSASESVFENMKRNNYEFFDDDDHPHRTHLSQVPQKETVSIGHKALLFGTRQLEHSVA